MFVLSIMCYSQQDTIQTKTKLQKVLYLTGASLLFAGVDYVGYNLTKKNSTALTIYRIFQIAMQASITWFLYKELGLPTAIGFNIMWWTFCDDFLYFGYAELFNPGGSWESRGNLEKNVFGNHATWAYWTPVGISRGMKRDQPIAGNTLLAQALIGAAIGVTITISF